MNAFIIFFYKSQLADDSAAGFFCLVKFRINVHINTNGFCLGEEGEIMDTESYRFANFGTREDLLEDLRRLESRMKDELGYEVALIAYTQEDDESK
ncbi:hypothetical protein QFZ81_003591 [Paenibacillus sp. V4I9]|nr:hypothetical protein [Paenibacillus sp. V4I9]